jgi:RNA polymerase sigma factor (sigma-70 family)
MILALDDNEGVLGSRPVTEQEKTLIADCVKGEKPAWDAFVRQYSGLIYHTIRKTFSLHHNEPRSDTVDDLFQEVFLSLVKEDFCQLRRFRGDNSCTLESWLRMIAARRTADQLRKARFQNNSLAEHFADAAYQGPDPVVDQDQAELMAQAVAELSPREHIVLDLFFRQGLTAEDVAGILRMSVGAVYTQKSRILAKLRETLEKSAAL